MYEYPLLVFFIRFFDAGHWCKVMQFKGGYQFRCPIGCRDQLGVYVNKLYIRWFQGLSLSTKPYVTDNTERYDACCEERCMSAVKALVAWAVANKSPNVSRL